ncbi:unnamed protein product [Cuscuta campestris]|uniref:Uncharacterized protein n=1 Tax=Cuscuta campestris TaxID=132261 RepID=A0A484KKX2_9ASTE|nr:unnamed protein product [Cuscuta campestris]
MPINILSCSTSAGPPIAIFFFLLEYTNLIGGLSLVLDEDEDCEPNLWRTKMKMSWSTLIVDEDEMLCRDLLP